MQQSALSFWDAVRFSQMIYKESWYGKWNKVMKNLKLVFALIAFIYVQFASGATWTDADGFTWTYSVANGEATITGVSPRNGSLSIPKTLGGGGL